MIEWTRLELLEETDHDTPALIAERELVNTEIEGIHAERQRIDLVLNVVKNTPISELTVEQVTAAQRAKEDHFRLLQRELRLRQGPFVIYLKNHWTEADQARKAQETTHQQIETDVQQRLEAMGYRTPGRDVQGCWSDDIVFRHPRVIDSRNRLQSLRNIASRKEEAADNTSCQDTLNRELNAVMRQLTGVSSGIAVNDRPISLSTSGIG